ncbi:TPA: DeoR/GlpR transcriptional regulator [Klebsiella pneumoniae]|uniref:DeoR/GlpR family DNA-binding transcription regulator n=1 Tax=Klebsiella TaxID=570 RepID=UPI0022403BCF|nr:MULTISPECIES: DeoR/GlpR family DNA-binding transcription regulator [Klebsiella]MBK3196152.1 DeoR/GlpR transcriptional regulator [Klebsiella pneumoniae]MDK1900769.1 DeoR/GlpR family DNA-binding transcription regulator [Klebsiella sp. K4-170]HCC8329456.1 DeoR/GlpR transcriptional regulator [Klebsiella pneumoniae]
MFAEERQEKLLGILREKRKVAVSEMCDVFNVSGATIRADLRQLEEEGLLTRTHGGAVLRTRASFEQASDTREIVNLSAKERIGQRAAALVEDGDIIVLDTGTTTLHIARNIRDRQNVTVVTNDYQIARELEASPSIQTILLGGIVKKGYHCVVAINGRSILDTLNVDKAFMGTNSLSLKHGACVADIMLAETKRGMVEHASQVIIVCDYSKLNNTSLAQFTAADRIDTVVVDRLPDDVQAYRNAGIQVISLDEEEYL